jgi:hypothetical protein
MREEKRGEERRGEERRGERSDLVTGNFSENVIPPSQYALERELMKSRQKYMQQICINKNHASEVH